MGKPSDRMPEVLMKNFDTLPLISENASNLNGPTLFHLYPNYPNPFNPVTTISYFLRVPLEVRLDVFTTNGEKLVTIVDGYQEVGAHNIRFDASAYPSGVYFARLDSGSYRKTIKMVLVK